MNNLLPSTSEAIPFYFWLVSIMLVEIFKDIEKHGGIHGPSVGGGVLGRAGGG